MAAVTDFNLRASAWYLAHQDQARRAWRIALAVLAVVLLGAGALAGLFAWRGSRSVTAAQAERVSAPLLVAPARSDLPKALTVGTPRAILTQPGRVDVVAEVVNPNARYAVRQLRYRFIVGGQAQPERTIVLLPTSRRFLFEANLAAGGNTLPGVEFETLDLTYGRPRDPRLLEQVGFTVKEQRVDLSALAGSPAKPAPRLTATIANTGVLGFRSVTLSMVLMAAGAPVAVAERTVTDWLRDTQRSIEVQWLQTVGSNVEAVIVAQTDLFDARNLLR